MTRAPGASRAQAAVPTGVWTRRRAERVGERPGMFRVRRMSAGRATLMALLGLAVVIGTALGVMAVVGALLHALSPDRHFDAYAAFHNQIVVACIAALSVLWLLPPHPWAKELVEVPARDDPEPRFPEPVTGRARVAVVSVYQGRAPPLVAAPA